MHTQSNLMKDRFLQFVLALVALCFLFHAPEAQIGGGVTPPPRYNRKPDKNAPAKDSGAIETQRSDSSSFLVLIP